MSSILWSVVVVSVTLSWGLQINADLGQVYQDSESGQNNQAFLGDQVQQVEQRYRHRYDSADSRDRSDMFEHDAKDDGNGASDGEQKERAFLGDQVQHIEQRYRHRYDSADSRDRSDMFEHDAKDDGNGASDGEQKEPGDQVQNVEQRYYSADSRDRSDIIEDAVRSNLRELVVQIRAIAASSKDGCQKCAAWYDIDRADTTWLTQANRELPCPCRTKRDRFGFTPVDLSTGRRWTGDRACLKFGLPSCAKYHPGADGCIRSRGATSAGASQQCCYDEQGKLIGPDSRGAGTPDRAYDYGYHWELDVQPYEWCCRQCDTCQKYLTLRKGSNSHC